MYIYAVSVHVDPGSEREWLEWMQNVHIPDVLKTGCFKSARLFKIEQQEGMDGSVFSIQYTYEDKSDFERYEKEFAYKLRKEHTDKFGNRCHAFRSHALLLDEFLP